MTDPEPKALVVLVTGGRHFGEAEGKPPEQAWKEKDFVWACLERVHGERGIRLLVTGACVERDKVWTRGADGWAERWAVFRQVNYLGVPAKWAKYGKRAGMIRNAEMPKLAERMGMPVEAAVAFPGGVGTAGMVGILRELGIPVWQPRFE